LDTAVYRVRDYLLINETITVEETKRIIDEVSLVVYFSGFSLNGDK